MAAKFCKPKPIPTESAPAISVNELVLSPAALKAIKIVMSQIVYERILLMRVLCISFRANAADRWRTNILTKIVRTQPIMKIIIIF